MRISVPHTGENHVGRYRHIRTYFQWTIQNAIRGKMRIIPYVDLFTTSLNIYPNHKKNIIADRQKFRFGYPHQILKLDIFSDLLYSFDYCLIHDRPVKSNYFA